MSTLFSIEPELNKAEESELTIPIPSKTKMALSDFELLSVIGKGKYAKIYKAKYLHNEHEEIRAIKVMDIGLMQSKRKLYQVYLENDILSRLNSPNLINIYGCFENKGKIYIVLDYFSKGDFTDLLRLNHPFKEPVIRFYAAEIVNIISYLQKNKVVHRDIKPDNFVLDENYHLKLIDFATAKILGKIFNKEKMIFEDLTNENSKEITSDIESDYEEVREKRGETFVGTNEYISPEVLKDDPSGFGTDLWALGVIIYQMYSGKTPFKADSQYNTFKKIEENSFVFPENIPQDAHDLIQSLLESNPAKRLGAGAIGSENDISHLMNHPFFKGINFSKLPNLSVPGAGNFRNLNNTRCSQIDESLSRATITSKNYSRKHLKTIAVIKSGTLEKKSPWFHYNTRKVVLDSSPKLEYIDPIKNIVKGRIFLRKSCKAEQVDTKTFSLFTPKRIFKFKVSLIYFTYRRKMKVLAGWKLLIMRFNNMLIKNYVKIQK